MDLLFSEICKHQEESNNVYIFKEKKIKHCKVKIQSFIEKCIYVLLSIIFKLWFFVFDFLFLALHIIVICRIFNDA